MGVFRRVGTSTVPLDGPAGLFTEVDVPCRDEVEPLQLRLAVQSEKAPEKSNNAAAGRGESARANARRARDRVEAAREYLEANHVEEVIALAMRELIQSRPANPHKFLAAYILENGAEVQSHGCVSPQISPKKHTPTASLAPLSPQEPAPPPKAPKPSAAEEWEQNCKAAAKTELMKAATDGRLAAVLAAQPKQVVKQPSAPRPEAVVPFTAYFAKHVTAMS